MAEVVGSGYCVKLMREEEILKKKSKKEVLNELGRLLFLYLIIIYDKFILFDMIIFYIIYLSLLMSKIYHLRINYL